MPLLTSSHGLQVIQLGIISKLTRNQVCSWTYHYCTWPPHTAVHTCMAGVIIIIMRRSGQKYSWVWGQSFYNRRRWRGHCCSSSWLHSTHWSRIQCVTRAKSGATWQWRGRTIKTRIWCAGYATSAGGRYFDTTRSRFVGIISMEHCFCAMVVYYSYFNNYQEFPCQCVNIVDLAFRYITCICCYS